MIEYNGYKIEGDGTFGMKVIKPKVGSLPDALKGSFTKAAFAMASIDLYLAEREERDNKPPAIKKVKLTPRLPKEVEDGPECESGD